MKKIYLLPALLATISTTAQFGPPQFLDLPGSASSLTQCIKTGDIDGNGHKDVIVSNDGTSEIRIYNNNGNLGFSSATNVPGSWQGIKSMDVADLDNDGKPDIVVVESLSQTLSWLSNTNGVFTSKTLIESGLHFTMGRVLCHDFSGDGNTDILLSDHSNVLLFLNTGGGNFLPGQNVVLPDDETEFYDIVLGDFNNDSYKDFALASGGFEIYLNDGNAQFTKTAGFNDTITMLLGAGDWNNDGLDDVAIKTSIIKGSKNSSVGTFSAVPVSTSGLGIKAIYGGDLNNDGLDDILSQDNQTGKIFWYKSNGDGTFAAREDLHTPPPGQGNTTGVYADDIDGDGDKEILWTNGSGIVALHGSQVVLSAAEKTRSANLFYPNPASQTLYFAEGEDIASLTIYNAIGQKVLSASSSEITGKAVNISTLQSGTYIVQAGGGSRAGTTFKLVKL